MPYEHFNQDDRIRLQGYLDRGMKCKEIAERLGKNPTSVSREVKRNRVCDGPRHGKEKNCLRCANFAECDLEGLCGDWCSGRKCRSCTRRDITGACPGHEPVACRRTERFPYVCNACDDRRCSFVRYTYGAKVAQGKADMAASEPRRGFDLTGAELAWLDSVVTEGMLKGQSLSHIHAAHADEMPCCPRTLYTLVNKGEIGPGRMRGIEMVARKPRNGKKGGCAKAPRKGLDGRRWEDYLALGDDERDARWEMDTVVGRRGGKCLLTLLHRLTRLQLALLLESCTQAEVAAALDMLSGLPGSPFAPGSGTLVLTDNGSEFFDADGIESGGRIRLYYCEPYSSWQKGAAERGHRLYRRILAKGSSFDGLGRADCALMMSHVNSMPRAVLGGARPLELAERVVGGEFLAALGLELVAPDEVTVTPALLEGAGGQRER